MKALMFLLVVLSAPFLDTNAAFASTTYSYDDLGRLKTATYDNGKQITYSFDPAGNRSQVQTQNTTPHTNAAKQAAVKRRPKRKKL